MAQNNCLIPKKSIIFNKKVKSLIPVENINILPDDTSESCHESEIISSSSKGKSDVNISVLDISDGK